MRHGSTQSNADERLTECRIIIVVVVRGGCLSISLVRAESKIRAEGKVKVVAVILGVDCIWTRL